MSEQYFQRPEDEHENSHIDDPLAELARIVTGEESRAEPASTHHNPQRSEEQNSDRQSKQPAISTSQRTDTNISKDLEANPFAKFVVKPVEIPEGPRKIQEDRTQSQDTRSQDTRAQSEVASASIFSEELPREDIDTPKDEDVVDPFADIDLELTELLEAGLAEEEVNNIVEIGRASCRERV